MTPPIIQQTHHADFPEMGMIPYIDVLTAIEKARSVQRYLEIGSNAGLSLARMQCSYIAVDPEFKIAAKVFNGAPEMLFFQQTSDDFFASGILGRMGWVPDLTFIDGMHLFEYALRDFMNTERAMTRDGIICIHDVCPFNYDMTTRDVGALNRISAWTGDVWKLVLALLDLRPDLTVDIVAARQTGLACISGLNPDCTVLAENYDALLEKYVPMDLADLGADTFYGRFPLILPKDYIAAL